MKRLLLLVTLASFAVRADAAWFDMQAWLDRLWGEAPSEMTEDPLVDLVAQSRRLGARRVFFSEQHDMPGNIFGLSSIILGADRGGNFTHYAEVQASHFAKAVETWEQLKHGRDGAAESVLSQSLGPEWESGKEERERFMASG